MERKTEIEIKQNWGQDYQSAKEHLEEMKDCLQPLKESGILEFKAIIQRKCDFCGRILKEGDKFETIGDLDKCGECIGE